MSETFPKSRRVAIAMFAPELLLEMMKDGPPRLSRIVAGALPADAKLQAVTHDPHIDQVICLVESASFGEVPPGHSVPHVDTTTFQIVTEAEHRVEVRALAMSARMAAAATIVGDVPDWATLNALLRRLADALDPPRVLPFVRPGTE